MKWLKKKKIAIEKKKKTKGRICATLPVTTKHVPELQCSVTLILCRNVHVFYHRTTAKGSEKKRIKHNETRQESSVHQVHFKSLSSRPATWRSARKCAQRQTWSHFCSKSSIIKESFVRKSCVKYNPCMDFENGSYKKFLKNKLDN